MAAVRESGLNCFDNFLTTLENRMDLITNYFISRSSSGWVEGLNNKIKHAVIAPWFRKVS
jgi:transposase